MQSSSSSARPRRATKKSRGNLLSEQADGYLIQRLSDLASTVARRTSRMRSCAGRGRARSSSRKSGKPPLLVVPLGSRTICANMMALQSWLSGQEHYMLLEDRCLLLHGPGGDLSWEVGKSYRAFTLRLVLDDPASFLSSKSGSGEPFSGLGVNFPIGSGRGSSLSPTRKCSKRSKASLRKKD